MALARVPEETRRNSRGLRRWSRRLLHERCLQLSHLNSVTVRLRKRWSVDSCEAVSQVPRDTGADNPAHDRNDGRGYRDSSGDVIDEGKISLVEHVDSASGGICARVANITRSFLIGKCGKTNLFRSWMLQASSDVIEFRRDDGVLELDVAMSTQVDAKTAN